MKRSTLVLLAILLFAAVLRFYRLDAQSLWSDEGASVVQAMRDIPNIVENAARDIHPPLYYILLHFWVIPFGASEIGVRSLSAALGVGLVLMGYLLGTLLWDARTGLVSAFLAALNPFQIYYSQEARMYMLMAVLGAVCVYASVRAQSADRQRHLAWSALYAVAAAAGIYTHYLFPIMLAVCNILFVGGWLASARARLRLAVWILVQVSVVLAFLPWLPTAMHQLATWRSGALTFSASDAPVVVLRTLSEGLSAPGNDLPWLILYLVLLVAGALPVVARRSSFIAVLYLLAPVAALFALALYKDAFLKFMLVASPPFVLLVANGVARLSHDAPRVAPTASRLVAPALLILLALPAALAVQNYYFDPRYARDDYRGIAQTIEALARDGDAIVLDAPGQQEIFQYYYRGKTPVYLLPRERPPDSATARLELGAISQRHARVFAVFWATDESDPQRVVESWLDAHSFKARDTWYGNVRLTLYANASLSTVRAVGITWLEGIRLISTASAGEEVTAGDVLPLTLLWRTEQPILKRYKVFVHLLHPRGFVIAQRDAEPAGGSRPTTTWEPGEPILDSYGLVIPFGTPPLRYAIEIGLYDLDSGQRLKNVNGEDRLLLAGAVQVRSPVKPPPLALLEMQPVAKTSESGLQLLGYQLDKLGAEGQRTTVFHAGDTVHLALYWRKSNAARSGMYHLTLGALAREASPTDELYPLSEWRDGEIVRDDQLIAIPNAWGAGDYRLTIDREAIAVVKVQP